MIRFRYVPLALLWVITVLCAFICGVDLRHWHTINHCGIPDSGFLSFVDDNGKSGPMIAGSTTGEGAGINIIGDNGTGLVTGGCTILEPGLYQIRRVGK